MKKKFREHVDREKLAKESFAREKITRVADVAREKAKGPLEKEIEKKIGDYAKMLGCLYWKMTSPSNPSVPDRVIVAPGGHIGWLELKRRGQKPTPKQHVKMAELKERGCTVGWVDNVEDGKGFVDKLMTVKQGEDWV